MKKEKFVKRTVKDTVFTNLFSDTKYLFQLYRCLHPEDTAATVDQITNVTLKPVLTNAIYNDLGFMVDNRLVLLVEAQSTWTENIVIRSLLYLAQTYQEYLDRKEHPQSVYHPQKVQIPKPEFYVIYTGESPRQKDIISLREEFYGGEESDIEVKVKVLYDGINGDIISQYVAFTKIVNDVVSRMGRTQEAAEEIIRICKDKEILREYLESREKEVFGIMIALFNDDQIQRSFLNAERYNIRLEEKAEAQKEVKAAEEKTKAAEEKIKAAEEKTKAAEEKIKTAEEKAKAAKAETKAAKKAFSEKQKVSALKMLKKGVLSIEEIADFTGLSVKAVKELAEKK